MSTLSKNEKICPELCLSLRRYTQMRAVIFFLENNQKQTEVATVQFQLEELLLSVTNLTPNITGLVKAKSKVT